MAPGAMTVTTTDMTASLAKETVNHNKLPGYGNSAGQSTPYRKKEAAHQVCAASCGAKSARFNSNYFGSKTWSMT
jgi:hypothetical protein